MEDGHIKGFRFCGKASQGVTETLFSSVLPELPEEREQQSPHEWHFKIPRSRRSGGLASANTF